ncbi:MAG: DUF2304 domain-containing protein [Clostridiales bacterium]|nr:DUF2304 domain-containing protein [Clostridiales bacterium]
MSAILRLFICLASLTLVWITLRDLIRRKLTEKQCLFWFAVAAIMFIFGIVPNATTMLAGFFGVEYAPSIIFAIAIVAALFGIYNCYCTNADLIRRVNELSIQISILNSDIKPSEPHQRVGPDRE